MKKLFSILVASLLPIVSMADTSWLTWVHDLKQEAVTQGIDPQLFDRIFSAIPGPSSQILHFNDTQPERRITFSEYRATRGDSYKILIGHREYKKHQVLLQNIGHTYHVDPCTIVALWGMETSYGHYMGHFPVVQSLSTLAYASDRKEKFRSELLYALQILNSHQISLEQFKGEWAGASGQPQFLPSSWFKYAVDYDQDGVKNIWSSVSDVFASIANYLQKNNWQDHAPTALEVHLPDGFDKELLSMEVEKPVSAWNALGVRTAQNDFLPYPEMSASVIQPDGGPAMLIYPNFKVLMTYNNSIYYAGTVGYMADKICSR